MPKKPSDTPEPGHQPALTVLTLAEAAARLRVCSKTLAGFLKSHPAEPPLFARAGRQFLISEKDLTRIYEEMKQCPLKSSDDKKALISTYAAPSEASMFSKLRALTTGPRPRPSGSNAKEKS
jgi:hypothetical protein